MILNTINNRNSLKELKKNLEAFFEKRIKQNENL